MKLGDIFEASYHAVGLTSNQINDLIEKIKSVMPGADVAVHGNQQIVVKGPASFFYEVQEKLKELLGEPEWTVYHTSKGLGQYPKWNMEDTQITMEEFYGSTVVRIKKHNESHYHKSPGSSVG